MKTPDFEQKVGSQGSILMLSIHGYVGAEPELGKPDTGGQVVFVLELAKRFARLGYKVELVTRRFDKQPELDRINPNLRVRRIPFGGPGFIRKEDMHGLLRDFVTNFLADAKRRNARYDVVSSHYWDAGWAGQRIAEELRIPHVHTPHSLGSWKQKDMKGSRGGEEEIYRFTERIEKEFLVYRNCDHVIATTEQQVELIEKDYGIPRDHITLIPPGIDEQRFTPVQPARVREIRQRIGFAADDVYCVARAATNKGIDLLIASLPALRRLVPRARLQLAVGAGSDRDRERVGKWKRQAQELGVAEQVRWIGYVPDEEMADHYRAPGVFALSSRYEPFGMTAIEAMACGSPVVATVHGGLHEAVEFGTHALFADPKCPEEFAAMLGMPLRYPRLRERLSIEGARFARRQFGWTGIARRTLGVFERFRGIYHDHDEFQEPALET
jgi:mannosylfructose-phosphate synthase